MIDGFEWDPEKARLNEQKHKVAFQEALTVFFDRLAVMIDDPLHSEQEERFILFGHSMRGRLLAVAFVDRGEKVRLISARKMTPHEVRTYERRTD